MSATIFVAQALGLSPPADASRYECGLCGMVAPARSAADVLKKTFTNEDELHSAKCCWACEACLNDRRTRSSFIATGEFRRLMRADLWPTLLDPPPPPFVLYMTLSGKKHGLFRQRVATDLSSFRIVCEDRIAHFDIHRDRCLMLAAAELIRAGARRTSIESGHYRAVDYHRVGIRALTALEATLKPLRGSYLLTILLGVMPSAKELKREELWQLLMS